MIVLKIKNEVVRYPNSVWARPGEYVVSCDSEVKVFSLKEELEV